jgi:hypothetical protein
MVLLKRDGKSLDYVEGVLGDISDDKIDFKLDGETTRVNRSKAAGVIFYRGASRSETDPRCVVHSRSGLEARVSKARLDGDVVAITLLTDIELRWPADDVSFVDFSSGKLLYLSDVEPTSDRWTPLVGLPASAETAAQYGRPHRNQSAYGGPLTLRDTDRAAATTPPLQRFAKGLALRSRTEVVYRLPAGFRRFLAIAGIDPATGDRGNVRFIISGDDQSLLDVEIAGDEPPQPIDVDITGVKQLKIVVDYGQNLDTGDWLNLCDARIVK